MLTSLGIDLGSGSVKVVVLCEDGRVLGRAIRKARADFEGLARLAQAIGDRVDGAAANGASPAPVPEEPAVKMRSGCWGRLTSASG